VALSKAPSAYTAGLQVRFLAANANTGASTLNVNGLGVKNLRRQDGTALRAGDILAGMPVSATYNGTQFRLDTSTAKMVADAEAAETAAAASTLAAANSEDSAYLSETNAAASAASALSHRNAADSAKLAAQTAQGLGEDARDMSQLYASQSLSSANAAATSAGAAGLSEANAAASEAAASGSAGGAAVSEANAAGSATSAAGSATAAGLSESNAASSELAAADSATLAASSESNAAASASAAAISETNASGSATAAAASATAAATSESNAATSASIAAGSEANAATSEGNALIYRNAAQSAQSAAEAARDSALAAYDSFDDRYLGAKDSDPTVDNDGNPLAAGSLYFNTVTGGMMLYTGDMWTAAYVDPGGLAPAVHTHTMSEITDLSLSWTAITGKPTEFTPSAHTHDYLPLAGGTLTGNFAVEGTSVSIGPVGTTSPMTLEMRRNSANWFRASATGGYFGWQVNGSDVVMTLNASGALNVTSTVTASGGNSNNWNTAYSWGNHAAAGYDKTNYLYNPAGGAIARSARYTVIQNWSQSAPVYSLNDSAFLPGDVVTIASVRGFKTSAAANRIYMPNGSHDTEVFIEQPGRITLAKYTGTAGYWMVLP
jgi:hypothetical protein